MKQSKYLEAASKVLKKAKGGGGVKEFEKYADALRELSNKALESGDKKTAREILSLKEALATNCFS